MLEKNKCYEITIDGFTNEGNGVGRIEGMAVFVPNSCEGDRLIVKLVKIKKSFAYAKIDSIITPSAERTKPYCEKATQCGGCSMAHIQYTKQLQLKKQFVEDAFKKIGGFGSNLHILPVIGMDQPLHYRNKMVFPIGSDRDGNPVGGFYRSRSHDIIPLEECAIGETDALKYLRAVLDFMQKYNIPAYGEAEDKGLVRRVMLRTGYRTKQLMLVLSINGTSLPHETELVKELRTIQSDYYLQSIVINCNIGKNNLVLGKINKTIYGTDTIEDILCGLSFTISPNSFYQVNPIQTEKLYQVALDLAGLTGQEAVVDLYSGIGTISLCAAKQARRVWAVEVVEQAVHDAAENAKRNGIENVKFMAGDARMMTEALLKEDCAPDVVFVDPPRKGNAPETLESIMQMCPEKIVYISCNPATLARDVRILADGGYKPVLIQPVDMFPGTAHIETVVQMMRQ